MVKRLPRTRGWAGGNRLGFRGPRFRPVFERFTDEARRIVVIAQDESRRLNHDYIGTEHLLLGMIASNDSVAAQVLISLGVDLASVRSQVLEIIGIGQGETPSHIPITPRGKRVFEWSLREAIQLGHHHIGSEHILLGLLREGEGIATQVLTQAGVELEPARARIAEMVAADAAPLPVEIGGAAPGTPLMRHVYDPAMVSVLFVAVALVAVVMEAPEPQIRLWGLSLLLGGTLLWAGGAVIGTGDMAGPRSRGMGRLLRVLGGLTLAAAASVFVLGALLS